MAEYDILNTEKAKYDNSHTGEKNLNFPFALLTKI